MSVSERPLTTVTAIMGAVFLLASGTALQGTAVTLRGGLEGFSDQWIGLIGSGFYLGVLGGAFLALPLVRSVGYVRTFAAFASLASASTLAHVLWINPVAWLVFRVIAGLCQSIALVVVESWLNASAPTGRRGTILSIYGIVYLAAMGAVQPLISVFSPADFLLFGVTSILISLCLLPVTLAQVSGTPQIGSLQIRVMGIFRKSPMGASGVLVSGVVAGAQMTLAPRYAQIMGMGEGQIGVFLLTFSLGTMALQIPLGRISDTLDRRRALLISSAGGVVAALGLSAVGGPGLFMTLTAFAFGGLAIPLYSLAIATVNDQITSDEMVEAASALYLFYGMGSIVGPLLASALMGRFGPGSLYLMTAMVLAFYLAFGVLRIRLVPDFRTRGRSATYRVVPRTTMMAFSMLRRRHARPGPEPTAEPAPVGAYDGFSAAPGEDAAMNATDGDYAPEVTDIQPDVDEGGREA